ncbi:MAG: ABC transporter ATP-binding protein [Alphaproteobacteria bacterium]|nr:ABC transporter ATP-binding protein [Alphaproteobacteria bacterium]MCB9796556.1 ABC transporter ATP-binding protein [Alphaproteobacteria bacterium]
MKAALRVTHLSKRFGRRGVLALDDLSCAFPEGAICGLIGPNGAGKTTLFGVVCGFLPPDTGEVDILGQGSFDPFRLKGRLGALPQDAALNDRDTCRGFLFHMALLQGMGRVEARRAADEALELVNLSERAEQLIGKLSHGMRRRVATASALLGRPELVLLDEPTAGLDPAQAASLRDQLVARRGASTLVISSHNLSELERICDYVVFIRRGACVREGRLEDLTESARDLRWRLGAPPPLDTLRALLPEHGWSWQAEGGWLTQRPPEGRDPDDACLIAMRAFADLELPPRELRRGQSLEESFLASEEPG